MGELLAIAGGCGISGERFFEHLAPSEKATHDRSERNMEFIGDFFIRELLQIGQDDDRFEFAGNRIESVDDFIGEGERFGTFDVGFERFEGFVGGRGREDRIVGEIGYDFVDIGVFSLVSSIFIDERIGEDAKEPCATIRAFFVGIEAVVSLDEGILDEVFGFHLVVCVFERHAIEG